MCGVEVWGMGGLELGGGGGRVFDRLESPLSMEHLVVQSVQPS